MRRFPAISILGFLPFLLEASSGTYLIFPFVNASGNQNLEWIGESAAEGIRETLCHYDLPVFTRAERVEASYHLSIKPGARLTKASVMKLASELDAGSVILGEFEWTPEAGSSSTSRGTVKFTTRIIEVDQTKRRPRIVEVGPMANLAQIQARLSWLVLREALPAAPSEQEFFKTHPPVRIDAMENYIRGLLAPAPNKKHRHFAQAARLDPEFAQPRFQLGRIEWEDRSYRAAAKWLASVGPSNPYYLDANFLLGVCRYQVGEYAGALAAFELVAREAPLAAVFSNLGIAQFRLRRAEAADTLLRAAEQSPMDAEIQFNAGYILWRQGDLESAADRFQTVLDIDPDDPHAKRLLDRCRNRSGPRRGDLSTEGLERLKEDYEGIAHKRFRP
ncbi:MAG: tetratricopeptide repeat protein [bacterium]|nr:tetratricopeptide repeat protein [bacterium]